MSLLPRRFVAIAALSLTLVATPAVATAAPGSLNTDQLVDQGEKITNTNRGSTCTAGYVDKQRGVIHTAGHCGAPGDTFHHVLPDGRTQYVGAFATDFNATATRGDIGTISVADPAQLGGNSFAPSMNFTEAPRVGDQICTYGQTSKRVRCGKILGTDGAVLVTSTGLSGQPGDSGGPAWVNGHTIGVYNADWFVGPGGAIKVASTATLIDVADNSTTPPAVERISGGLIGALSSI